MESDISLSLCSDQALVKGKQCLVDFIHIVVSSFDKIFYNDVEFARMGKGKPCLAERLLHLDKWQLQHPEIVVLKYAVKHIGQQ